MARIVKERERVQIKEFHVRYERNDMPGAGYAFECNEDGSLKKNMSEEASENFVGCITGEYDVTYKGIICDIRGYTEPALLECDCGYHVKLYGFTNTCDHCERDYNSSGQLLAPREQWGEETNETLADILGVGDWDF